MSSTFCAYYRDPPRQERKTHATTDRPKTGIPPPRVPGISCRPASLARPMTGIGRVGGPAATRPATRRPGPARQFHLPPEEAAAAAPAGPATAIGLAALLALQDEQEPKRDRAARRHARALLDELDALHAALLGAAAGDDGLARLAALVAAAPDPADHPTLREAVADIRLRARIELARYAPAASTTAG
jgi:hypothetical protein